MEMEKTIFPKEKFVIGEPYQRKDMDEKIGETKINNRSGSGVFSFENTVVLLVTLEQELSEEGNSYDDFLVGIESVQKTIENFAFNQESYWNLKDKEISPEKHSEETSIRKLTRMQPCKRDMEWLEKHRVPFTPPANQSDDA